MVGPAEPPANFPPVTLMTVNDPYPGTLLFTTATNPFAGEVEQYSSFIAEIDKQTGALMRYRRILTKGYLFQPQPEGYSYAVMEKTGVNGAGHDGTHYLTDMNLKTIASFKVNINNGTTDTHEFLRLENGNALLLSYVSRQFDMRPLGGREDALVYDPVVVEITPEGETIWEWHGVDHLSVANTTSGPDVYLDAAPPVHVDYAHPNALSVFPDGNLLLSLKHMDCVLKIDRESGQVLWTIGGPHCSKNEFTFFNDPHHGFSHQHTTRILPNGNLLLFDNGTLHDEQISRAVEYALDEKNRTAELIWSYSNGQFSHAQGSVERLPNGNTLIGWGFATQPFVSEITPDGQIALEMNLPEGQIVYRVYQGLADE